MTFIEFIILDKFLKISQVSFYLSATCIQNSPCLDVIPEGYTDLSTPSAANPNKKNIKIQAPDGKKFSTIKAAQEYYTKSLEKKDEGEVDVEELENRMDENEANTEARDVEIEEESDDDDEPGINLFLSCHENLMVILFHQ